MVDLPEFPASEPEDHAAELGRRERLAELEETGLMDSVPEEVYDRAVRLARQITGAPVGLLSLVDNRRQFFKAQSGLADAGVADRETPLSHSFCQYVVSSRTSLAVVDARTHPLLAGNGAVGELGVIAYLGVPVRGPGGEVLGSFCAIDSEAHEWSESQLKALEDIAGIVESEIKLHQALAERQLLVEELNHRVKNLFTVVSGMVRLSHSNGEAQVELEARLQALANAHNLLAPLIQAGKPVGDRIALSELLETLLTPYGQDHIARIEGPNVVLGPRASTSLSLALHELATNAAKYGALAVADGRLAVQWWVEGNSLVMDWREAGRASEPTGTATGFGTRLISVAIEGQLDGTLETDLRPAGMTRRITISRERLAE
ncbi:sensor histidine kinase [Vannielia litorea]|uniref:histidine kinase n=1 Tax=Vannielia litorea TaxID=1217970 RepID=A0A1N6HAP3_9RHOB|nr:GAF domain-containing protein [Vannielia litorea]SIO16836.1 Two-component sensor histidine kinase, contains HisKA and HATPase domains [Vannielia litorea]